MIKKFITATLLSGFAFFGNGLSAQTIVTAPVPPEIQNSELLGINKEPYHATLTPYANLKGALVAKWHASSLCQTLNGQWKFNWVPRPEKRPVDFYKHKDGLLNFIKRTYEYLAEKNVPHIY